LEFFLHGAVVLLGVQPPVFADGVLQQQIGDRADVELLFAVGLGEGHRPQLVVLADRPLRPWRSSY